MMCRVCSQRFEDTRIKRIYDEYPYGDGYEAVCTNGVCPCCGSEEIVEEARCLQCGEDVSDADLVNGFCRFCAEELEQTLDWIVSMLTPAQRRWMADHPEWVERGDGVC